MVPPVASCHPGPGGGVAGSVVVVETYTKKPNWYGSALLEVTVNVGAAAVPNPIVCDTYAITAEPLFASSFENPPVPALLPTSTVIRYTECSTVGPAYV